MMLKLSEKHVYQMIKQKVIAIAICGIITGCNSIKTKEIPAPYEIQVANFKTYSFENGIPDAFSAGADGKLSINKKVSKEGDNSLQWEWSKPGASITYTDNHAFKYLTGEKPDNIVYEWITFCTLSTFKVWIFNEKAVKNKLWFEIGDGKKVDCRFWMSLDFSGWRLMNAMYGRDIEGFPNQKTANRLKIIAPKNLDKGMLLFDSYCPRSEQDVRFVRGSKLMPWVGKGIIDENGAVKGRFIDNAIQISELEDIELPEKLTIAQVSDVKRVKKEYFIKISSIPKVAKVSEKEMMAVRKKYSAHNFKRDGQFISGTLNRKGRNDWGEMAVIANLFHKAVGDEKLQNELRNIFFDYADLMTQHQTSSGYGLRASFARPMLLMKKELKKAGKFKPLLGRLRLINGVIELYKNNVTANADKYNTLVHSWLSLIFLQDDLKAIWKDLKAYQKWLERTAVYGEIRPDGSFFHHNMTYTGYNFPAIGPMVDVNAILHNTEFSTPVSHLMARRIAYAMHYYSGEIGAPHTLAGRWRHKGVIGWDMAQMFRKLAEIGNPETEEVFDKEMAEIYLYYADHYKKTDKWVKKYQKMGLKPHNTDGNLSLNYTPAAVHRRNEWMVFFRGQRREFFSMEAYGFQGGNTMGRYISYGHLALVSPTNPSENGVVRNKGVGWNFNFWPGTTVREIPHDALRSHFLVEEAVTAETYAVGTSLDGNGIFGMKLQEDLPGEVDALRIGPPKYWLGEKEYQRRIIDAMYDPSFKAKKSVFCFDNRILCLGSGIVADDKEHRVCTTLFQHILTDEEIKKGKFPETVTKKLENADWIMDRNGYGYYLPAGNDPLIMTRKYEKLPYYYSWNPKNLKAHNRIIPNEGNNELAIIDHGKAPDGKGYEYCIVMDTDSAGMKKFTEKMKDPKQAYYKVIRRDDFAHIVYDAPSKTTGYVIFDSNHPLNAGILQKVSKPVVAMIREMVDHKLRISICDPELDSVNAQIPHKATKVTLTLKGKWKLSELNENVRIISLNNNFTELGVTCRELLPVIIDLK